ncbi:MAG TPA: HAD family hydrolase, partial [bacterium]|nr:HAD family hydrolase [bacterium]
EDDFPPFRKATLFSLFFIFLGLFGGMALSFFQVIFHQLSWDVSLGYGLAFFLSFCLISYPGTIMISTHVIRKNLFNKGILVKKLSSLPKLADLDLLYLNKTGTLTQGTFVYAQHYLEQGSNQGQLLSTFFSLAAASHHPLAEALETHPWYHEITRHPVEELKEYPGLGVCGYINPSKGDHRFFAALGNLRFLKRMQMQVSRDMKNKIDDLEALGETVLLGGYDRFVRGVMSFADVLRTDIHSTLKEIQELQIEPAIITGDAEDDVSHLITELKLTKVYARCTPEEKAAKIEKDIADGKIVGFVGSQDYSLPFEKAHVSVSVDTGTQIIDQTADVLILGSRIRLLSWLLQQTQQLFSRNRTRLTTSVILSLLVATTSVLGITSAEFVVTFICLINILTLRSSAADAS